MKNSFFRLLLSAALMMCCLAASAVGTQPSGDGSQDNPYLLANYDNLLWFADQVNNQGRTDICAKLTADIVATGAWTPIGTPEKMYTGDFNGDGYSISELTLNNPEQSCVGLFGKIDTGSHIHHVSVISCNFTGYQYVGAICGDFAAGSIEYCFCSGSIKATADAAGGIVGSCYINASILHCHTSCSVSSNPGNYGAICGALFGTIGHIAYEKGCCDKLVGYSDTNCRIITEGDGLVLITIKEFSSTAIHNGELCWWLNKETIDGTQAWYQDLNAPSSLPKPSNRYPTLYCHTDILGNPVYSNVFDWRIYGTPPDDEFWYTTTDGKPVGIDLESTFEETVTNNYHNGRGVIKSVNGNDLDVINEYAISNQANLKAISMGDNIDGIGRGAFENCKQLTEVSLSPDLRTGDIGINSFWSCSGLNLVELRWDKKSNIASLPMNDFTYVFPGCHNVIIRSVYLEASAYQGTGWDDCPIYVKSLDGDCFTYTYNGTAVRYKVTSCEVLQKTVTIEGIEFMAQYGVVELPETVYNPGALLPFPYAVTGISANAFKDCTYLVDITIPETLASIGASAFSGCTGITEITLPETLASIGASAFNGCTNLKTLNLQWRDASKVVTPGENAFANCVSGGQTIKLNIPYGIKTACESIAPYNDTNIFNLHWWTLLSASGTPIVTPKVFDGNAKLTAENIGLSQCQLIETNVEPEDKGKVWLTATAEYSSIYGSNQSVTVTYGLGMDDEIADKYRIEQTATVSNVGFIAPDHPIVDWEFVYGGVRYRITGISPNTVSIPDREWSDRKESVDGDLIIPESIYDSGTNASYALTYIGRYAFSSCQTIKAVDIPGTVKSIGFQAFYQTSVTSVILHEGLEHIGNQAFIRGNFTSITIPASVKNIERFAFDACKSLSSVTFNSLPTLDKGYGIFKDCNILSTKILDLTDSDKPYIGTSLDDYPGFTEARYHRTLEKDKWETIVLPFVPTSESMDGLKFYVCNIVSGGKAAFSKTENIEAGVPYLVKNISDSKTEFTFVAATPIDIVLNTSVRSVGGFTMKGTFQSQKLSNTDSKKFYCLDGDKFKVVSGEQSIDPFRVYLETGNMSAAESLTITDYQITLAGDGTSDNPYQIGNREELEMYAQIIYFENSGACAILTNDIVYNEGVLDADGKLNSGKTFDVWSPMGSAGSPFAGKLDGNGHTISGLYFNDGNVNNVGLFGKAADGAYIHDLGVKDSYFYGKDHVGGICGDFASGKIENCWSEVAIYVTSGDGGGLTGSVFTNAVLKDSYTICSVDGAGSRGLVCGALYGKIENCYAGRINPTGTGNAIGWTSTSGNPTAVKVEIMNEDAFKNGKVCWLLNGGSSENVTWHQTLGENGEKYPTLTGEGIVYLTARYCDGSVKAFSNTEPESVTQDEHTLVLLDGKAHCEWCEQDWEHYLAQDNNPVLLDSKDDSYSLDKVELKYGHPYLCTDDVSVNDFSYAFRYYPNVWNSWFVPFEITTGELGDMGFTAAYIAGVRQYEKDAEGDIITQVDVIKITNGYLFAGTPYLIKQESAGTEPVITEFRKNGATLKKSSDVHPGHTETMTAKYDFIGTYNTIAEEDVAENYYIIGNQGAFAHPSSPIYAMNWYLEIEQKGAAYGQFVSSVKSIIINVIGEEDQTTGIRTLYPVEKQVREVYDLSGRRLDTPKEGQVNIINGKKILVK